MTDREKLLKDVLDTGDVLIRRTDNGATISHVRDNVDKTYDTGEINEFALGTIGFVFEKDHLQKKDAEAISEFLFAVMDAMGIIQSDYDAARLEIEVKGKTDGE